MKSIITGLLIVLLLACSKEENPTAVVLDGPSFLSHQLGHTTIADIQALTLEQQIGQLLIRKQKGVPGPAIVALIRAGQLGGLQFSHIHPDSFLLWRDSLQAISPHPLYISLEGRGTSMQHLKKAALFLPGGFGRHQALIAWAILPTRCLSNNWSSWASTGC